MRHFQPITCVCVARELRIVFTFLNVFFFLNRKRDTISWHIKIIRNSNFSVYEWSLIRIQPHSFFYISSKARVIGLQWQSWVGVTWPFAGKIYCPLQSPLVHGSCNNMAEGFPVVSDNWSLWNYTSHSWLSAHVEWRHMGHRWFPPPR